MEQFSLYKKYKSEVKKYKSLYEKYGIEYSLSISYDKNRGSINYVSCPRTSREKRLSVYYNGDGEIDNVFACVGPNSKWDCLLHYLNHLESKRCYYSLPFTLVSPQTLSICEKEGMFDVMMQTVYTYIQQTNQNVTLGVSYKGFGYAHTPEMMLVSGKNVKEEDVPSYYNFKIYDSNVLYVADYYKKVQEKNKTTVKSNIENNYYNDENENASDEV